MPGASGARKARAAGVARHLLQVMAAYLWGKKGPKGEWMKRPHRP